MLGGFVHCYTTTSGACELYFQFRGPSFRELPLPQRTFLFLPTMVRRFNVGGMLRQVIHRFPSGFQGPSSNANVNVPMARSIIGRGHESVASVVGIFPSGIHRVKWSSHRRRVGSGRAKGFGDSQRRGFFHFQHGYTGRRYGSQGYRTGVRRVVCVSLPSEGLTFRSRVDDRPRGGSHVAGRHGPGHVLVHLILHDACGRRKVGRRRATRRGRFHPRFRLRFRGVARVVGRGVRRIGNRWVYRCAGYLYLSHGVVNGTVGAIRYGRPWGRQRRPIFPYIGPTTSVALWCGRYGGGASRVRGRSRVHFASGRWVSTLLQV